MTNGDIRDLVISSRTIREWDGLWEEVPGGFTASFCKLNGKAGLYRVIENGETVVIGKGAGAWKNRLAKRLSDFVRPSGSGRDHRVGRYIHANRDRLTVQVLVTGTSSEACKIADSLRGPMIELHQPRENVPPAIVAQAAFG